MNNINSKIRILKENLENKLHKLKGKKKELKSNPENPTKIEGNILNLSKNIELIHKAKKELYKLKYNTFRSAVNEVLREQNKVETGRLRNYLNREQLDNFNELMKNVYNIAFVFISENIDDIEIPTKNNMNNHNKNKDFYEIFDDYIHTIITDSHITKKIYIDQIYEALLNEVIVMYNEYNSNIENTLSIYTTYIQDNIPNQEFLMQYLDSYVMNNGFYNPETFQESLYDKYSNFEEQLYEQIEIRCEEIINDLHIHSELGLNKYHFLLKKIFQYLLIKYMKRL